MSPWPATVLLVEIRLPATAKLIPPLPEEVKLISDDPVACKLTLPVPPKLMPYPLLLALEEPLKLMPPVTVLMLIGPLLIVLIPLEAIVVDVLVPVMAIKPL